MPINVLDAEIGDVDVAAADGGPGASIAPVTERTATFSRENERLKSATIMMVDDEPIMMDVVQTFLEEAGYRNFITLEDSTQALDTVAHRVPDVLLLDLMMPKVTGFDILFALRSDKRYKHLPVVVLTSSTDSETKLKALELGATDFLAKPVDASELVLRLRNTLAAKAYQDQLAYYDGLTGMPNRSMFRERVRWMLQNSLRDQQPLAVIHLGLDRFKEINESFGPTAGDELLQQVATAMQNSVRSSDSLTRFAFEEGEKNLARLGGDEFGILLSNLATAEDAAAIARRLQEELANSYFVGGRDVFVTTSLGIACFPEDGKETDELLQHAAGAMHQAKTEGSNAFRFYSSDINAKSAARLVLESELRRAVSQQELVVFYQPKIEIRTGRVIGAEALARWLHPERGLVPPADFIPIAEDTGLIIDIGAFVLEQACWQLQEWQEHGLRDLSIAVNVSSIQLRDGGLPAHVRKVLTATGVKPPQLTLELTETAIMAGVEQDTDILNHLKHMGIKLSIDDFGTGYSSLSYLKRFPLDELKIDRSFVMDIGRDNSDESLVSAIIAMSHSLGLEVCAEGVETREQLSFLAKEGCERFQGYLVGKPMAARELTEKLSAAKGGRQAAAADQLKSI